jgi:hypothetical protein
LNDITLTPVDYRVTLKAPHGNAVLERSSVGMYSAKLRLNFATLAIDSKPSAALRLAVASVVEVPGAGGSGNGYFPGGW